MSQYKEGFCDVVNGSANVVGNGTEWLANVQAGDMFVVDSDQVVYEVASVTDDLNMSLSTLYGGASENNGVYTIARNFTPNLNMPTIAKGDIETAALITKSLEILDYEVIEAGQLYIDDLLDVNAPSPVVNDLITWDGAEWIAAPATGAVPGEANTSSNSGGGIGLAQAKSGTDLPFKTLLGGVGVSISDGVDEVTIGTDIEWGEISGTISNQGDLQGELNAKEDAFTHNSAFNQNFGGSGAATDVSRSDHDHGGQYEPSFTKNSAFNKDFGVISGSVSEGNHSHDLTYEPKNSNIQAHIADTSVHSTSINLSLNIEVGNDKDYTFTLSSPQDWTIDTLVCQSSAGTVDATIKIDGVNVTGLDAVGISTTLQTYTASALNAASGGDPIVVTFSNSINPRNVVVTLTGTFN